mmetsp:Transcript_66957/g.192546  ORF Transcript_66957/g.192546 Transcript_66957/m.192546 type:complete len:201 (-) Transcript_66957:83-685(-)
MTTSAPALQASIASASDEHSTSIFIEKPTQTLAFATALVMLPVAQTWLSLSITMADRLSRCVAAPPTSSAYFSTSLKPGVVLRVPATMPCHRSRLAASTAFRVTVATPLARERIFSAVLSPRRTLRAGPRTLAVTTLPWLASMKSPSSKSHSTSQPPNFSNTASKKAQPQRTPLVFVKSFAAFGSSPTTKPPMSKLGISS